MIKLILLLALSAVPHDPKDTFYTPPDWHRWGTKDTFGWPPGMEDFRGKPPIQYEPNQWVQANDQGPF